MYDSRIIKIQNMLGTGDAALISSYPNMLYLTGMPNAEALVIVTSNDSFYLTDFRYIEHARKTVKSCSVIETIPSATEILKILKANDIDSIYVETDNITLEKYNHYCLAFEGISVINNDSLNKLLKSLRSVKSPEELNNIKAAQEITDDTFKYIIEKIKPGRTEYDLMLEMDFHMRSLGSVGTAFDTIFASGFNSSMPHAVPTSRTINSGDFVTMDFGAVYNGYCSDMTRTIAVGNINDEQKDIYYTVLNAQLTALDKIRSGLPCNEIDKVARDVINEAGYEGCFEHGLGHSVGLEIHENPSFNKRCRDITRPGMVITVEPGIYLTGKYGVRIEDMICVTDEGCINLTNSPKELILL